MATNHYHDAECGPHCNKTRKLGPVCELPSGRIVGCVMNVKTGRYVPHQWGCECSRCEPDLAAKREQVRDAAPELLAALKALETFLRAEEVSLPIELLEECHAACVKAEA